MEFHLIAHQIKINKHITLKSWKVDFCNWEYRCEYVPNLFFDGNQGVMYFYMFYYPNGIFKKYALKQYFIDFFL